MTYTRDDLPVLPDPVEFIRQHGRMFLPRVSGEVLSKRLVDEARLLAGGKVVREHDGAWWLVAAEKDWLRAHSQVSIEDLFAQIVPFPEAGANSMRAEVLLTAFARNILTFVHGQAHVIQGDVAPRVIALLLTEHRREWGRVVAFQMSDEEEQQ